MKTFFSKSVGLVVLWSCVASCAQENTPSEKSVEQPKPSWETHFSVFAETFELAPTYQQNKNAFDFNGDSQPDYIYFLKGTSEKVSLPNVVLAPVGWKKENASRFTGRHVISIVHGGTDSTYLLNDADDMSLFDTQAATESFVMKKSELASTEEPNLINKAKGDVIVIPTSAGIDNYIYWDGKQYELHEVLEMP